MTAHPGTSAIDLIQTLFDKGTAASLSDAQLAERFVESRDHEAFSALVGRHGPMVMAVCRGLLGPVAEDYRSIGLFAGPAFENLTLKPGDVRDLGEIRTKAPVDVRRKMRRSPVAPRSPARSD